MNAAFNNLQELKEFILNETLAAYAESAKEPLEKVMKLFELDDSFRAVMKEEAAKSTWDIAKHFKLI